MVFIGWVEIEFGLICAWRLFYLCFGAIVIDDAYLLRFYHALPDNVVEGVVILHSLHLFRLMVNGPDWADKSPLSVERGHFEVIGNISLADLRNGST